MTTVNVEVIISQQYHKYGNLFIKPSWMAQLDACPTGDHAFDPCQFWQYSFVGINHEIFSAFTVPLLLIKEGQLSVSGKRINLHKYWLTA